MGGGGGQRESDSRKIRETDMQILRRFGWRTEAKYHKTAHIFTKMTTCVESMPHANFVMISQQAPDRGLIDIQAAC